MDSTEAGSRWETAGPVSFAREAELQDLLQTGSAELIPADAALDEACVVYAREVFTRSGPIDLVGIGSSGSITIMECKLARNQQIKREVVGQVLDYAASLWQTDLSSLAADFKRVSGSDPFEALRERFGGDGAPFDEAQCRAEVARRLRDGDFRLLIAVDEIDAELRRIIQYVNHRAETGHGVKLVALAFPRYEVGSTQLLIPETYGDEAVEAPPPRGEMTDVQHLHFDYWTAFVAYLEQRKHPVQLRKPTGTSIAASVVTASGFLFRAWNRMNDGKSGVEAIPKSAEAVARFALADRQLVNQRLGRFGAVDWIAEPPSVWVARDGKAQGMPTDRDHWPFLMEWMAGALGEYWAIFGSTN